MIEKKMELLEEENDRLKKEIEDLREACKVQEQTISKLWNAYVQLEVKINKQRTEIKKGYHRRSTVVTFFVR